MIHTSQAVVQSKLSTSVSISKAVSLLCYKTRFSSFEVANCSQSFHHRCVRKHVFVPHKSKTPSCEICLSGDKTSTAHGTKNDFTRASESDARYTSGSGVLRDPQRFEFIAFFPKAADDRRAKRPGSSARFFVAQGDNTILQMKAFPLSETPETWHSGISTEL